MRITIRVKPGSSRERVGGSYDGALVVAVQERAVDGKATDAALATLAAVLGCRKRDVTLVSGVTSRTKIIEIPDGYEDQIRSLATA